MFSSMGITCVSKGCKLRCGAKCSTGSVSVEVHFLIDNEEHFCAPVDGTAEKIVCAGRARSSKVMLQKSLTAAASLHWLSRNRK